MSLFERGTNYYYQVGGTLAPNAPCYILRQADLQLYRALKQGQFCYVLNCRQMGKSSLLLNIKNRLLKEDFKCVSLDFSIIGNDRITPTQWYKGLILELWQQFGLIESLNFQNWWQAQQELSDLQKLRRFISEILLVNFSNQTIFIFIDEIDSILSLDFSVDDLFVLIRYCYNQRASDPRYNYISFALFGVATPSELIDDPTRTPFNIGTAIELNGFTFEEALPLTKGLELPGSDANLLLREILFWTAGQPFLTQKLCNYVHQAATETAILSDPEAIWLANLVRERIITDWEFQDEPEHLRTIQNKLESYREETGKILAIYQQILQGIEVKSDRCAATFGSRSSAQTKLLMSGLAVKHNGHLKIKNRIYQEVFNLEWVERQLEMLRPYPEALHAWLASNYQDESRLLRGKALKDAQKWAIGKSLSGLDYKFLLISEEYDRNEKEIALEAERTKAIAARLRAEQQQRLQLQKNARLQKLILIVVSAALIIVSRLGFFALKEYRNAKINEIKALASASKSLLLSHYQLEAMTTAISAKIELQKLNNNVDNETINRVTTALIQTIYNNNEFNRLERHQGSILTVDISPDDRLIATGSNDKTVKIWQQDGKLLKTIPHGGTVARLVFSPDSKQVITVSLDGTLRIWGTNGTLIKKIQAHQAPIWGVAIAPNGKIIATASGDRTVKLWQDGKLLTTLKAHQSSLWAVAFSNDSQTIVSVGVDRTIKLWNRSGTLLKTFQGHQDRIWDLAFCPRNNLFVTVSSDRTAKLWNLNGRVLKTIQGKEPILGVDCQGKFIATTERNNQVKVWSLDGSIVKKLNHQAFLIRDLALNSQGLILATASNDGNVRLWRCNLNFLHFFYGHQDTIWELAVSSDSQLIASASFDGTVKLWQTNGKLWQNLEPKNFGFRSAVFSSDSKLLVTTTYNDGALYLWNLKTTTQPNLKLRQIIKGHQSPVYAVAINPQSTIIASGGNDRQIKLWDLSGKLLHDWRAHQEQIWKLVFTPDGKMLASASEDGTVKLWNLSGKEIATLKHPSAVWGVAINPQGTAIASSSWDDKIRLWNLKGELQKIIPGQSQGLTRIAFSPDGRVIATGGVDRTVKLWSIDGKLLRTLSGHQGMVVSLAFTPDGKFLFSGSDDSTLIRWDLQNIFNTNELEYACNWVRDYLKNNLKISQSERKLCEQVIKE